MFLGEALRFSGQALRANPVRTLLTGLGMAIGTASVILVVTISLTSRDYILEQVQGIGSNIIFAYYANAGGSAVADADYIKMSDVQSIRRDLTLRTKTALLTDQLAARMFGGREAALSQIIKIYGLQFTVIGTFHEKVETFGQSEVERDTILMPITVLRYFTPVERIDPLYVQVRSPLEVDRIAAEVHDI